MKISRALRYGLICIGLFFALILLLNIFVVLSTTNSIKEKTSDVPAKQTALILGASVYGKRVSVLLEDRLKAGLSLYREGKVKKIIVSGDHSRNDYNEVKAMRDYLTREGVPEQDIFMDHAGLDTYDSVFRARDIFQVKDMVIVSQRFHLYRALFIAKWLGVDAVGLSSDLTTYARSTVIRNELREFLARIKAFFNLVLGANPAYLGEVIPVTGDGRVTND